MLSSTSLQNKLVIALLSIILLLSCAITIPSLYVFSDKMLEMYQEEVLVGMHGLEDTLEELKALSVNYGFFIANQPEVIRYVEEQNTAALANLLKPYLEQAKLDSIVLLDAKGNVVCRIHDPGKKGDSLAYQSVVQNALKGTVTTAVEKGTAVPLAIRAANPVKNAQGQIIGAVSVGYSINNNSIVDKIKEEHGVEVTLFMEDTRVATTIVTDGKRAVGTKVSPEIAEIVLKQGQSHMGKANVVGVEHIAVYKPLIGPDGKPVGILFAGHSLGEYYAERNKLFYVIITITALGIAVGSGMANVVGRKLVKPLEAMVKGIEKDEAGNISIKTVEVHSKDEIGQLNSALNTLVKQVQLFVRQVGNSVELVSASSEQLTANAEQSAQAANQAAVAVSTVATGTEQQSHSLEHAVNAVSAIVEEVGLGASQSGDAAAITRKAVEATERGSRAVDGIVAHMGRIEGSVLDSAAVVAKLGQESMTIGKIVDTISGIASQTNLLALNAAIEAARAGEQGRGFAVVAEEVRRLAEQSACAAKEIAGMISKIQGDTRQAVEAMESGAAAVKEGTDLAASVKREFQDIESQVNQVSQIADGVAASLSQLTASCTQVMESMRQIDQVGKGSMEQTQTISAAAEEQSAAMQEIASASQSLAKLAQELQSEVMKFKI